MDNLSQNHNSASTFVWKLDDDLKSDAEAISKHKSENELKKEMFCNFDYDTIISGAYFSKIYKYKVEIHPQAFAKNFDDANTILKSIYKNIRKEYGVTLFYLHEEMYARKRVRLLRIFRTMHKEREVTVIIKDGSLVIAENANNLVFYNLFFRQIARNQRLRFINSFLFSSKSNESSEESSICLFYKLTKNTRHHQPECLLTLKIPNELASIKTFYNLMPKDEDNEETEEEMGEREKKTKFKKQMNVEEQVDIDGKKINGTVVVTTYNRKNTYIISEICYDMNPTISKFERYDKETGSIKSVSYVEYLQDTYNLTVTDKTQPMIKAHIQNKNESIYLVPELCWRVGKSDPINVKNPQTKLEYLIDLQQVDKMERAKEFFEFIKNSQNKKAAKNSRNSGTRQRSLTTEDETKSEMGDKSKQNNGDKNHGPSPPNIGLLGANDLKINYFKDGKPDITKWAILYLENDELLADRFIRELKNQGDKYDLIEPHSCKFKDEQGMANEIEQCDEETSVIVIIVPCENNRKIYKKLKRYTMTKYNIPTQFVNIDKIKAMCESEDRKKLLNNSDEAKSIFGLERYCFRILCQIFIKVGGTPWKIGGNSLAQEEILIIGISFLKKHNESGKSILCATFSANDDLNRYFAVCKQQDKTNFRKILKDCISEGLVKFKEEIGAVPAEIVVYREEVSIFQQANLLKSEILMIQQEIKDFCKREQEQESKFCFIVTTTSRVSMYFTEKELNIPNAQLGTYVSETKFEAPIPKWDDFLLVSRMSNKNIPVFTHYLIMHNELQSYSKEALIELTYRLCGLYFHSNKDIEIPAPLKYAQTLRDLIGNINDSEEDGYKLPGEILKNETSLCFI